MRPVQFAISDFGFEVQDSSDFQFLPLVRYYVNALKGIPERVGYSVGSRQGLRHSDSGIV